MDGFQRSPSTSPCLNAVLAARRAGMVTPYYWAMTFNSNTTAIPSCPTAWTGGSAQPEVSDPRIATYEVGRLPRQLFANRVWPFSDKGPGRRWYCGGGVIPKREVSDVILIYDFGYAIVVCNGRSQSAGQSSSRPLYGRAGHLSRALLSGTRATCSSSASRKKVGGRSLIWRPRGASRAAELICIAVC